MLDAELPTASHRVGPGRYWTLVQWSRSLHPWPRRRLPLGVHHVQLQVVLGRGVALQLLGNRVQPGVGVVDGVVDALDGGLPEAVSAPRLDEVEGMGTLSVAPLALNARRRVGGGLSEGRMPPTALWQSSWLLEELMTVHHARVIALAAVLVGLSALILSSSVRAQQPVSELPLDELRARAEQGDAQAQYNLGVMYATGRGVPQDDAEAVRWWRLAADQGDAEAQYNLGVRYADGRGVPQDDAEAAKWFRRAAEQGAAKAQHNLGFMYENGRGVRQDYAEAVRWFRKAAEQGDVRGQYNLGFMYANGQGVPQDIVQAQMWFTLAAEQGAALAQNNRDKAASEMTPDQIAEAQRMAREWKAKHQR